MDESRQWSHRLTQRKVSTISIEWVESSTTCQKYEGVVRYVYDAELGKSQLTLRLLIRAGFRELLRQLALGQTSYGREGASRMQQLGVVTNFRAVAHVREEDFASTLASRSNDAR